MKFYWFRLQSWRWEVLEACVFASALSHWSNNLRLVRHTLAKELLQLWVWPLQHVLEKNWNKGSYWLPLRKCWSICLGGLDTSRSYPPGVDQVEQPLAYISQHILLQLCYQAYQQSHGSNNSFWHTRDTSSAVHQNPANESMAPSSRCASSI